MKKIGRDEKRRKKKPWWPAMRGVRGQPGGAAMASCLWVVLARLEQWPRQGDQGGGGGRVIEKTAVDTKINDTSSSFYEQS
jgi:hypothetical protein